MRGPSARGANGGHGEGEPMSRGGATKRKRGDAVILLRDLAPRKDVTGGAGKRLFGERREPSEGETTADDDASSEP